MRRSWRPRTPAPVKVAEICKTLRFVTVNAVRMSVEPPAAISFMAALWFARWMGTGASIEEHLEGIVNAFVDAWNERDSDKRTELLNASFAPDASLRDPFSVVVGRDEINDYIATAHASGSPGRLERSGPVQAAIPFGWRVRHTSGEAVTSGTNYAELSLEAKLRSVVGFWDVLPHVMGCRRRGRSCPRPMLRSSRNARVEHPLVDLDPHRARAG
jgi:SnoaL-like domain